MNKSDTEKGNKVVKKEPAQKKTTQKRPMGNRSRFALLLVSLVAVIGGLIVAGVGTKTKKVKQESNVFTYQVNTTSSYQVVLKNNSIYNTPTLEEGRVYSDALTDHIAVQLRSELVGDQAATLHVDYDINAELDGFFNNDPTKKVYSKVQNLKHVSTEPTQDGRATVEESVDVSPDLFAGFVTEAEKELGSTTSKSMSLVFSGKYYIDVNGQQQTKDFTYTLPMPIRGANKLYTVDKPDAAADSGSITNSTLVKERPNQKLTPVGVVLLVIGLGMGASVLVLTKAPDEVEADKHTDRSEHVEHRERERTRQLGGVAAERNQSDKDDEECRENTGVRKLDDVEHRDAACNEGDDDGANEGDEVRRAVFRMDIRHCLREEAVTRHRIEDARLTEDVNDEGRDHTEEDTDRNEVRESRVTDEAEAVCHRVGTVEICIVDRRREDECHNSVDAEADEDRCDNADRKALLRGLALLGGGCDRIESHEGEEHDRCARHDARSTEGKERFHVLCNVHVGRRYNDVPDNRAQRERDEDRIEARALLCAVGKNAANEEGDNDSGEVDDAALRRRCKECLRYLHPEGRHHS